MMDKNGAVNERKEPAYNGKDVFCRFVRQLGSRRLNFVARAFDSAQ